MFVLQNETGRYPLKIWLENEKELEASCREQAYHLTELPFLRGWVCLMPDTHAGMGMPIGGVIAAKDVIVPNAVGVDIGCGMAYVRTNVPVSGDKETAFQVSGAILDLDGLTRIVVTHALDEALLRRYDGILVLKNGAVAECGRFDELMARKGYFYSLYTVAQ